jgi:hypothetical protein
LFFLFDSLFSCSLICTVQLALTYSLAIITSCLFPPYWILL